MMMLMMTYTGGESATRRADRLVRGRETRAQSTAQYSDYVLTIERSSK